MHQSCTYHVLQDKSQTNAAQRHFQSISQQSNQIRGRCIGLVIFPIQSGKKCKTQFLNLIRAFYIGSQEICEGWSIFRKNRTLVKSWSKTTVIISHLVDLSVRGSYFSNRYPGQVFVKVRGAQKQMPTSCCTIRWYCILLQRSHCHINWFCGDMKYHFDIWLCIFQVQPIWDIFLPSIDYYKTICVIFLIYALIIAKQSATLHHNSIHSTAPIG